MAVFDYTRDRSLFWLRIFDNDGSKNISANIMVKRLLDCFFPQLIDCGPIGWKPSDNYPGLYNLWIPDDCMDWQKFDELNIWAAQAHQHIWLGTNNHTNAYFIGSELDYCIAADWNFSFDTNNRTPVGEAEYQLKYQHPYGRVDEETCAKYTQLLITVIMDCIQCLPFDPRNTVVTTIPAVRAKQGKLAWFLAQEISGILHIPFIGLTLNYDKPQIKQQSVKDKVRIWRSIFSDRESLLLPPEIYNKSILIIDDLYQSGASIWCLAKFLKEKCWAQNVMAITAVKSLRDGDNT